MRRRHAYLYGSSPWPNRHAAELAPLPAALEISQHSSGPFIGRRAGNTISDHGRFRGGSVIGERFVANGAGRRPMVLGENATKSLRLSQAQETPLLGCVFVCESSRQQAWPLAVSFRGYEGRRCRSSSAGWLCGTVSSEDGIAWHNGGKVMSQKQGPVSSMSVELMTS